MNNVQYSNATRGSEVVIETVRKRQKGPMILFLILTGFFLVLGILGFIIQNYVMVAITIMFIWPFLIPAIIFIVRYKNPMKCKPLKKNPAVLKQADWMFANMSYQDEMIIISPNFFAPKSDPAAIIPVQEVLLMFKRVVSTNLSTMYFWVVETVRGTVNIQYTKAQEEQVNQCVQMVTPMCPYVRVGHNQENLNYMEYMRTMWEQTQKNQGTM